MEKITRKSMLYKTGVEYGDYTINHVLGCSHGCKYPCYAFQIKFADVPRLLSAFIAKCNLSNGKIRRNRAQMAQQLLNFLKTDGKVQTPAPPPIQSLFDSPQIDDALTFADLIEISNNFNALKPDLPESQAIKAAVRIAQNSCNKNLFNFIKE